MNLDIGTMSLMVSVASIMQSITLIFFFFLANQANRYRGIGTYAVGTVLSAIGFLIFPIRLLLSDPLLLLHLRFIGNLMIALAQIFYTIGIGKFLNKKINFFFFLALATTFLITHFYFIYINSDFIARSLITIFVTITSHVVAIYYLIKNQDKSLLTSSLFAAASFIFEIVILSFRAVVLPMSHTKALLESNPVNSITFWSIFLFDYLRNAGFLMMVSQRLYQDINRLATLDFLTNALNRRAMQQYLEHEIARFRRSGIVFSLILLDVDHFKFINDTYGHDQGDLVLQTLTTTLQQNLRTQDVLSRWGGEEFLILLPNTNLQNASLVANRLRTKVEANPAANGLIYYTISLGVGTFGKGYTESLDNLLITIDKALYQAKNQGRNQVATIVDLLG